MADSEKTRTYLLGVIAVVLVAAMGYFMQPVAIPIVLAIFFAILVQPLHRALSEYIPSALSLTLVVAAIAVLLVAIPLVFVANIQAIAEKVPEYAPRIEEIVASLDDVLQPLGVSLSDLHMSPSESMSSLLGVLSSSLSSAASILGTLVLTLFTVIFVLSETRVLREKLAVALDPENEAKVLDSVHAMSQKVQKYVVTKSFISFLNALSTGLFTWALGIDFPFVWAVLTFMFNFIPNVGTLISLVPLVLLALIQFDSPTTAIVAGVGLIVIYNLIGNVLEPRLLGRALALSPLVVFISLLFWGWYWGAVGVVLSIPLTVAIRIICQHIEPLRPIAVLMGHDPSDLEPASAEAG